MVAQETNWEKIPYAAYYSLTRAEIHQALLSQFSLLVEFFIGKVTEVNLTPKTISPQCCVQLANVYLHNNNASKNCPFIGPNYAVPKPGLSIFHPKPTAHFFSVYYGTVKFVKQGHLFCLYNIVLPL